MALIIFCVPSLVATLLNRERAKGSPLTEQEVLEIRDKAHAIVMEPDIAAKVEAERGYKDIDPENVWEEGKEHASIRRDVCLHVSLLCSPQLDW